MNGSLMVYVERHFGKIAPVSLELISKARSMADDLGVSVTAAVPGHELDGQLAELGHYGCDTAYVVEDPRLDPFTAVPHARAVAAIIRARKPQIVLFGATSTGRAVAPRVASELKCGLTADCTDLRIGEHQYHGKLYTNILQQIRPAFGGNIIATIVSPESSPSMATVREGVMALSDPDPKRSLEVVKESCEFAASDFTVTVEELTEIIHTVNLKGARVIVSAGMGVVTSGALPLVQELAEVLGAEVGASRPVVDSGVLPKEHQVGQTGTTVRPNLYIACGISGQIQHRAGMAESKRIVAVNIDPEAPIFKIAHYGIVGDVNDVLPMMIKAYRRA